MSNVLDKVTKYNPKLIVQELVLTDGDYAVLIGQMGEDDNPHYLVVNVKYGVIEAGSGALAEVPKLLEFCLGRPLTKKDIQNSAGQKDLVWN